MSAVAGEAAYRYIERAASLAVSGDVHAICTAPLNKEALHAAGHLFPGHTELLAHLTGTPEVSMMLEAPGLRVVHVTTHIGILDAIDRIDPRLVGRTIRRADETLRRAGIDRAAHRRVRHQPARRRERPVRPRRGGGQDRAGRRRRCAPTASTSSDRCPPTRCSSAPGAATSTASWRCTTTRATDRSRCSGSRPVSTSRIGLPVVRTSVDHGTAFDIAGTGVADERSMVEALRQAVNLATAT